MNEKWMEEIKHNDAVCFAEKYFPEQSFGDKTERVAELCRIAEKSGFADRESICKIVFTQIGKNAMPLNDETIAPDGRRIIGKKYISDADASESGACKACLEYAGRIFKWPEEKDKMPVLPRHPNCKCHYEDVYEESNFRISSLSPEKIVMPEMTPRKWDEQSKEEKLNWCNLFKTKFSEYISKYSTKYNVPKSLLTLIIANELVDWQNADGTAFDGMRGGGVGYAQIAIDTLLKEGISGYEHELSKTIRSNKYIPKFLVYRIIRGKIHRDLRTTEGSVKFAAKLLRKYIEYYDSKVITNSFGPGFAKTGLFFLKRRDILCQQENITELMLPDPIMQMFCAIWNSGKGILDAKEKINDTNYRNAFIHASNAEILIEYLQNLL